MNTKRTIMIALALCLVTAGGELRADDTEIYGAVSISVQPNVLIIFDTSGSMGTCDIPSEYYDPATVYSGSYTANAVYQRNWVWGSGYVWQLFTNNVNNLNCAAIKDALLTKGYATGRIQSGDFTCGGTKKTLHIGNYRNYDDSGAGTLSTRISVAKQVIVNLINNTSNVRFGLMRFNSTGDGDEGSNDDDGGRVVSACGTDKTSLINTVNGFTDGGYTPLAETLAEAGLYFGGKSSWFNAGTTYTSPIQVRCQRNFIILMTDGEPTFDKDPLLASGTYINGDAIGDYDGDGNDPGSYESGGSDYLDDVAKYLYENDISALGSVGDFEKQNVITYTIGFTTEQQLLQDTATNGGGEYYTANNISGLTEAFTQIMAAISEDNSVFVSPVVPVSRMNRTYAGNYIYVGFFKPQPTGGWIGNLKKYGLDSDGDMIDANGMEATTATGSIKDNAISYWSLSADGPNVAAGGAGEVLVDQGTRNIYTYLGTQADLTHADNQFLASNALITNAVLDVASDTERTNTINVVRQGERTNWKLGDILHSQPIVVHYDINGDDVLDATYIFAGSNDGMLHCFNDDDGSEVWAFVPPDQLTRLKLMLDDNHDYFVDGSPVLYDDEDSGQKILFFGERRGGNHYYALDVTAPASPLWLYKVEPDILGGGDGQLGQSWSRPEVGEIKIGGASEKVFFLAGGYDTNQDADVPGADSLGRAVLAVDVTDGSLSVLNFNAGNFAAMTHCIVDITSLDSTGDGYTNRAYAGDLGGNMFAFENDELDGTWSASKLFSAPGGQKVFYAPDAVEEKFAGGVHGEYIYFGTGDRADPEETGVENRFYAIKNNWVDNDLTEADLVDVTDDLIQLGTAEQKQQVATDLEEKKGWYIRLENSGEKVTSSPIVYGGIAYFTTYTPVSGGGPAPGDVCGVSTARGEARLYEVNYSTGASHIDYSPVEEIDQETGEAAELGKLDRVRTIGTSIASAPVIAVLESGPQIYIGVEGGIVKTDAVSKVELNIYYWRQIF
jgi:type IV pilus assembly protein PilY1